MKNALLLFCVFVCRGETINFDGAVPGSVPDGWMIAMTNKGGAPKWEVLKDPTAPSRPNVLAQTSTDKTGGRFPLAIWKNAELKDGTVSVAFKPVAGTEDQAAGIVWRFRDENNYYIVRANALEDNVVLYKVEAGKRVSLAPKGAAANTYGVKHRVPKAAWSTLRVVFKGSLSTVYMGTEKLFEVEDTTFQGPGKVGLWTKSDSVTYFDDFEIGR